MELHVVDSNRALATSRSSGRTTVLRWAPLAAVQAILAAVAAADTTSSWVKVSRP